MRAQSAEGENMNFRKEQTWEKAMTMDQQLGMVTLKNTMKVFADYGVDFQIVTQEDANCIKKRLTYFGSVDVLNSDGEIVVDDVTEIAFMLHKDGVTKIRFYNTYDEILELDRFKGFEYITATFCR